MKYASICAGVLLLLVTACKKGDTGPKGRDGNANVIQLNYGSQTFTGVCSFPLPDSISQEMIDSSVVLVYYVLSTEAPTSWYTVPGLGSGGLFETRMFVYQSSLSPVKLAVSVRLVKPDGTGSYATAVTFSKTRVIIIPASKVTNVARYGPDLGRYDAVKSFYGLGD